MADEVGSAFVSILPSLRGFSRRMQNDLAGPSARAGEVAGRESGDRFVRAFRPSLGRLAGLVGGAFAGLAVGGFLKDSIGQASDLGESASKVGVVFGQSAGQVRAFAKTSATALGQSEQQALEAAGTFGNLFVAMGLAPKASAQMSTSLVSLAGDLASFNNVDPAEALDALRSGLTGETEPLKRFGVNINQATLEAYAMSKGLVKTKVDLKQVRLAQSRVSIAQAQAQKIAKKHGHTQLDVAKANQAVKVAQAGLQKALGGTKVQLSAGVKAQAAYALILDQTKTAQGDFARTSGGLANQQRILAAQFSNLKSRVGASLLPAATGTVRYLSTTLLPTLDRVRGAFVDGFSGKNVTATGLLGVIGGIGDKAAALIEFARQVGPKIGAALADAARRVQSTVGQIRVDVTPMLGRIVTSVRGFAQPIIDAFRDGLRTGDYGPLGKALGKGIGKALSNAGEAGAALSAFMVKLVSAIDWEKYGLAAGKQAPKFLAALSLGFIGALPSIIGVLARNWKLTLIAVLTLGTDGIGGPLVRGLTAVVDRVLPAFGARLVVGGLNAVRRFSGAIVGAAATAVGFMGRAMLIGIRRVFPEFGAAIGRETGLLATRFALLGLRIVEAFGNALGTIGGAIAGASLRVAAAIGELLARIALPFAKASTYLYQAGRDLVVGLLNGAKSILPDIGKFFGKTLPGAAKDAFKKALGIHSPSTVFKAYGGNITQGLVAGIVSGRRDVNQTVARLVPAPRPAAVPVGHLAATATAQSPATGLQGSTSVGAHYSGPITVVAQDPDEMNRKLEHKRLLQAIR